MTDPDPTIPDPDDPDGLLRWGLLGAATAITFGFLLSIPPWPEDAPEPVERHASFDRRPSTRHERAVYRALIDLHAPRPVDRSRVPEAAPEPPLVPLDRVVAPDGAPAIPSAVEGQEGGVR